MNKKIAFRTDTNEIIATGHVMRCLSIAQALRAMGGMALFVSSDENILPFTQKEDFETRILHSEWNDKEAETDSLIDILSSEGVDVLFVDSYSVTKGYFDALRHAGIRVVYIDDLCSEAYPVDALVNYCPAATELGYETMYPQETALLLGSAYIPLRDQFGIVYDTCKNGLFITAGGADSLGVTDMIIRALLAEDGLVGGADRAGTDRSGYSVIHLLAGRYYKSTDAVLDAVSAGKVILHQNVDNVAQIMSGCKAAVSSAGTTLFELSALGIITASFVFADNQMTDALYFDNAGLMPYVGDFRVSPNDCIKKIIEFIRYVDGLSYDKRQSKSTALSSIIDGHGADRLADFLLKL